MEYSHLIHPPQKLKAHGIHEPVKDPIPHPAEEEYPHCSGLARPPREHEFRICTGHFQAGWATPSPHQAELRASVRGASCPTCTLHASRLIN